MRTAKFYVGDMKQYAVDFATNADQPLHSIQVLESTTYDGPYTVIDTQKINPAMNYIITDFASDDYLYRWYRLKFISDPAGASVMTIGTSDPVVPEVLAQAMDDVREWLGDTNAASPCWPDKHYVQSIRFALKQYKGEENATFIRDDDIVPIQLLVREIYAQAIAYDHARYYQLQTPSAQLDKSQIMTHYISVAAALRDQYNAIEKRLNRQGGGYNEEGIITQMPSINCVDAVRTSRVNGFKVRGLEPTFTRTFY